MKKTKKKSIDYFILLFFGIVIAHFFTANFIFSKDIFDFLDLRILDVLQNRFEWKKKSDKPILIVADTKSIDRLGRWPWSRDVIAEIVRSLNKYYEVNSIGFDIVFSEPDKNYEFLKQRLEFAGKDPSLQNLTKKILSEKSTDSKLADELKLWENVVMGYLFFGKNENLDHLGKTEVAISAQKIPLSNLIVIKNNKRSNGRSISEAGYLESNIEEIMGDSMKNGFFNMVPEADGVVRKIPLFFRFQGKYFESLDLVLLRQYYSFDGGLAPVELYINENGAESVKINGELYKINSDGTIWINYKGREEAYATFSAYDVLQKTVPKEKIKGKIAYIGVTEVGVYDIRSTPVSSFFPGVEVHANALDNLLQKDYLIHDQENSLVDLIFIIAFSLISLIVLSRMNVFWASMTLIIFLISYLSLNIWMFFNLHTWYTFYAVIFVVLGGIVVNAFRKYYFEGKEKKFIRNTFDRYLSPLVINQIIEEPDRVRLGGESKNISILFSDIVSFTTMSEKMKAEELILLLNEYLTQMTNLVFQNKGTIDKYIGDAIVAFYGAPLDVEQHEISACLTAIQMQNFLSENSQRLKEKFGEFVQCRIGINTGNAIVGNIGSAQRMDYTMIGDSVNLAARLEATNKKYSTKILVSDTTWNAVKNSIEGRKIDVVRVKGKSKKTTLYELQGKKGSLNEKMLELNQEFNKGIAAYENQEFAKALKIFATIIDKHDPDDTVTKIFINRCVELHKNPPGKEWDGVFES